MTKVMKGLAIIAILALVVTSVWFAASQLAANSGSNTLPLSPTPMSPKPSPSPTTNPTITNSPTPNGNEPSSQQGITPTINPTPTEPPTQTVLLTPSPTPILTPTPTPTPPPTPITATFDFDTGTPTLVPMMNTPLDQTNIGVTARFSSPSDPAAFSVQSYDTTFIKLSQFQGNYLNDNKLQRDTLEIRFSQPLSSITFTFATFESHGAPTALPGYMTLTAYMDTTSSLVGSTSARGTWPTGPDAYPQGTLTYNSLNQAFNFVRIELPVQSGSTASEYLIDKVIVTTT